MLDLHIDDFYKDVAKTLVFLYQAFPRKIELYVEDIHQADEPDEFGLHSKRFQACLGAMIWLGEEGYLRFEQLIRLEGLDQAVLSHRSFMILTSNRNIDTQSNALGSDNADAGAATATNVEISNIDGLRQILKSHSSEQLKWEITRLLSLNQHHTID